MIRQLLRSVPVLMFAAGVACSPPPAQPAPPAAAPPPISQATIDQNLQGMVGALAAGDMSQVGEMYAPDAVFVNARGRFDTSAGIEAFWAEALKTGAGKGLALNTVKSGTSGDLAYSLSRFTGGITATSGYVLAVSERQADGSLKTVAQVSIPDPPAK